MMHPMSPIKTLQAVGLLAFIVSVAPANAASFDTLGDLSQPDFRSLSENLAAATHYKAVSPGEPLGVLGFDVSLELSATKFDNDLFNRASGGDYIDNLLVARVHAQKGLPLGFDVGASVGTIPGTGATLLAGEIRYALMEGGIALPALGLRASYSLLEGDDNLDLTSAGVEAVISKGFLMLTPYAGAGVIRSEVSADFGSLEDEEFTQRKMFVGINVNLGINFAFEVERTGDFSTATGKVGIRF